jgi:hypothetical protein
MKNNESEMKNRRNESGKRIEEIIEAKTGNGNESGSSRRAATSTWRAANAQLAPRNGASALARSHRAMLCARHIESKA